MDKFEERLQLLESKFQHIDDFLQYWVPIVNESLGIGPPVQATGATGATGDTGDTEYDTDLNRLYFQHKINTTEEDPKKSHTGFQTRKIF